MTDHWMADGRATVETATQERTRFDSARLESRYRFLDEGSLPVDIAVSGEVNWEREEDGSMTVGFEPRLILSKDVAQALNLTLNLSEEIPLGSDPPAFLAALGTRFNFSHLVRLGTEFQYDFHERAGSVIPQLWFAFPRHVTLKVGYSWGLRNNGEDFGRVALEIEF